MKRALITGVTGQDGSYLAEYLLSIGYEVHGIIRRASTFNTQRIDHIYTDRHKKDVKFFLHYGDLIDATVLNNLIYQIQPDEIYNLAAQSHVQVSFQMPEYTGNVTGLGVARILGAIKSTGVKTKFYQASSSEMFGNAIPPQNENSKFSPQSPYAAAKVYAFWMTKNYRDAYNLFACNGILFNHESPRRGETFVTRKITRALANILAGKQKTIYLGNLDSLRDWGFAPEYVKAMWLMLQQEKPDDYVLGTGKSYSVREFFEVSCEYLGIEIGWSGKNSQEIGIIKSFDGRWVGILDSGDMILKIDPKYFRPTEVNHLRADISKAKKVLNWEPEISFSDLVKIMIDYDLKQVGVSLNHNHGINIYNRKSLNFIKSDFI